MTPTPAPRFDKHIPIPRKGKPTYHDAAHAYLVGQEGWGVSAALLLMEVGDSCLLSNWANTSVHYITSKYKLKFQRQLQPDGTVRIWRTK